MLPGGMPVAEFLRDYWQKRPLLIRNAFPGFHPPLDGDELAGLACEEDVESRLISGSVHSGRWQVRHGPLSEEMFGHLPERDWTLLVQDVEKHVPELAPFLDHFDFIPGWRVDDLMISYAADGGSVGPHVDAYDVFLLQAAGRRRWQVGTPDAALAEIPGLEIRVLAGFEARDEWLLEPGDMLYLPPNVPHYGIADGACMTWSIGFRAPSLAEMIADLGGYLSQRAGDGTHYTDPDLGMEEAEFGALAPAARERMRKLVRAALALDDAELDEWFGCFLTEPKPWLRAEAAETELDAAGVSLLLGGEGILARDSRSRLSWLKREDGRVTLFADGNAWHLGADAEALLHMLCTERSLSSNVLREYLQVEGVTEALRDLYNNGILYLDGDGQD